MPAAEAVAALCQIKGIGPWTAEIYLMFCAGHPDIFPAGDLALQKAVGHALELGDRVAVPDLMALAEGLGAAPPCGGAAVLALLCGDEEPRRDCPVTTQLSGPMMPPSSGGALGIHARGINIAYSGSTMYAEKWSTIASRFGVTIVT